MSDSKTPTLDLLRDKRTDIHTILEFLEDSKLQLAEWVPCLPSFHGTLEEFSACIEQEHFVPTALSHYDLVLKHFGIDSDKVEKERRELLSRYQSLEPEGEVG